MSQPASNQCCGNSKRRAGTAVVVCASIATISMTICALFTFDIPLYAWFAWMNVIMNVTILVTASIFVCQCCGEEGCKPHLVQGIMMAYCILAVISFIVCASGADAAIRHNCEDTIKCDTAEPWTGLSWDDDECGHKTSRFQLCTNPDTGGGHLYYSKWGDDCDDGGGKENSCRGFATEKDCWYYCNPHDDDADEQCDNVDHPDDCNNGSSIYAHAHLLAFWSSVVIVLLLVPSAIWTFCLFQPDPPKSAEPSTAVWKSRGPRRVDGVGRPKFDFHTGRPSPPSRWPRYKCATPRRPSSSPSSRRPMSSTRRSRRRARSSTRRRSP